MIGAMCPICVNCGFRPAPSRFQSFLDVLVIATHLAVMPKLICHFVARQESFVPYIQQSVSDNASIPARPEVPVWMFLV